MNKLLNITPWVLGVLGIFAFCLFMLKTIGTSIEMYLNDRIEVTVDTVHKANGTTVYKVVEMQLKDK